MARVSVAAAMLVATAANALPTCPPANFSSVTNLNFTAYIATRWYSQQMAETSFQPTNTFNCVYGQYKLFDEPNENGYEISVYNHGFNKDTRKDLVANLCAKIVDEKAGQLSVAPCFIPSALSGPYWIVYFDDAEGHAIISGGAPTEAAEGGCRCGTGANSTGLWLFTRQQKRDEAVVQKLRGIAADKGFDLSVLLDVDNSVCTSKAAADIDIATFDGATESVTWTEQNDPVMGGGSFGTTTINTDNQVLVLNGTVVNVPRLGAPGFIKSMGRGTFNDVSSCKSIVLNLNSKTAYKGYTVTIGSITNAHLASKPFYQYGYKANFEAPVGTFGDVVLPFSSFTLDWDDATGLPVTTCAQNASLCPSAAVLKDLQEVDVWGEAANGDIHLEVKSIRATDCSTDAFVAADADVTVATFDGAEGSTLTWRAFNDPVMGGKSVSSFHIDTAKQVGVWNGTCAIVPQLGAPGFITAQSTGSTRDVSNCKNLVLNVNSATNYTGYRVSFGVDHYPGAHTLYSYGYKSNFTAPVGEFQDVVLPFSGFTLNWDDATAQAITTCANDPAACVTTKSLQDLVQIQIWAEAVVGDIKLEINSIRASGCVTSQRTLATPVIMV